MELEEAIKRVNEIKEEYNRFDGLTEYVEAIDFVITHLTKQDKMIQKIHENFCKFDWKNSNGEEVHNQLKELYESIFKNEESE